MYTYVYNTKDIGANLTSGMYQGYYSSKKHDPDLNEVLERSWKSGLDKIIITGGCLKDAREALHLALTDPRLFTTVGCHPTRCDEFKLNPEKYLDDLRSLIKQGGDKVVAIGECGLDNARLKFCSQEVQLKYFEYQLQLSAEFNLPLFLHCREAFNDFADILGRNKSSLRGGVVHSFDGSKEDLEKVLELGMYVGINGCSLRTEENLQVAASIPVDRLMIETDCPYCEIKPTHPGFKHVKTEFPAVKPDKYKVGSDSHVKGRNEPGRIVQVLEVLAGIRNENADKLAKSIYENTCKLFFNKN